jgi:fructose-1,6-bisphosphatase/inositol monophosphatase family enzyme
MIYIKRICIGYIFDLIRGMGYIAEKGTSASCACQKRVIENLLYSDVRIHSTQKSETNERFINENGISMK